MQADEALDDRKAQARAAALAALCAGREAVEHLADHLLRNARATIGDGEDEIRASRRQFSDDRRALRREVGGIGEQLDQDLLQALRVGDDRCRAAPAR